MKREPEKVTREKHGKITEEKSNTTFSEGADPELRRCDSDTYQCQICTKKGSYAKLVSHLQGHQRSMVEYGGYSVYRCHLDCVKSSHYHCWCCTTIIATKQYFIKHFITCCKTASTATPQSTVTPASTATPPSTVTLASRVTPPSTATPPSTVTLASTATPQSTVTLASRVTPPSTATLPSTVTLASRVTPGSLHHPQQLHHPQ
ncbi:integumentary mucin C.1-like [Solea solea]|uniref:integumentary mucin C.1-like n=1 Tax=Solea solea TaxID=90069 RepID=UPI00272AE6B5|nr:integumentary mucin C.1-like [Solea solea]